MRTWRRGSPMTVMTLALLAALAVVGLATGLATGQPWLGLSLEPTPTGAARLVAVDPSGPAAHLPVPAEVRALAGGEGGSPLSLSLSAEDLTPEPDVFPDYAVMGAFFARQSALDEALRAGSVRLLLVDASGAERWETVVPRSARPVGDLPPVYWFQVAVGLAGVLLASWVWSLRRGDWSTRLFALTGLAMLVFTVSAAVYSTRELALDGRLFRLLSDANASGALMFGAAMIGVFLGYPRRLVPPAVLLLPLAVFGAWLMVVVLRLVPGPGLGPHLATLAEMLCIVAAIAAQWWATRRDPTGRAALTWLGLSVILGAGAFVALVSLPPVLGGAAPIPQGYAFGFFLLIHTGLALGLRRYRLFELGGWSFRVILATLGLAGLLALDAALIVMLNLEHELALGLSLLAIGFLYLPLRDLLWRRIARRRTMPEHELFEAVMDVAFVASPRDRATAWTDLLRRLFDPLETAPASAEDAAAAGGRVAVRAEGLEMVLPPVADAGGLVLRLPWGGRALFTPAHRAMAARLVELMVRAEAGRDAHARGARAERRRIARDLHDDVGARLLAALHQRDLMATRETVRGAMADIRAIVSGLNGQPLPLADVLADLRHETAQRLEGAGIVLDWAPPAEAPAATAAVDYPVHRAVTAVVREAVSNVIRHSGAGRVHVTATVDNSDRLRLSVADDGRGLDDRSVAEARPSHGFGNMHGRLAELGGALVVDAGAEGLRVTLDMPLGGPVAVAAAATPAARLRAAASA